MMESPWSQRLFARQTQIYSNGISSTTFAQLRNILLQKRQNHNWHGEHFREYMTTFAALMIYNSGGHSLFEIFEVLKLAPFNEIHEYAHITSLLERDELMEEWLQKDQNSAFDTAINQSIQYMNQLIPKRVVNAELQTHALAAKHSSDSTNGSSDVIPENDTLHDAVLYMSADELRAKLQSISKENRKVMIESKNNHKMSPLMLAAQLGKLDHAKVLVEFGAKISIAKEFNAPLTALELAIKWGHVEIVQYLLNNTNHSFSLKYHDIPSFILNVISGSESEIKGSRPLYLASRQNNIDIIKAVYERYYSNISENHNWAYFFIAYNSCAVENVEVMNYALERMEETTDFKKTPIDSVQLCIHSLISRAVGLGNQQLLNAILTSKLYSSFQASVQSNPTKQLDFTGLIKKAFDRECTTLAFILIQEANTRGVDLLALDELIKLKQTQTLNGDSIEVGSVSMSYDERPVAASDRTEPITIESIDQSSQGPIQQDYSAQSTLSNTKVNQNKTNNHQIDIRLFKILSYYQREGQLNYSAIQQLVKAVCKSEEAYSTKTESAQYLINKVTTNEQLCEAIGLDSYQSQSANASKLVSLMIQAYSEDEYIGELPQNIGYRK